MSLSSELISQFAKIAADKKKTSTESTTYGTTVMYNGKAYVKLDGSDLLTPVETTSSVSDGDRVTVTIKNHTATITGNTTDPAASSAVVKEQGTITAYKVSTDELEAINASIENLQAITAKFDNMTAINADIENLKAKYADLEYVDVETLKAVNAEIESLEAKFGDFENLSADDLEAITAEIQKLKGYTANFTYVIVDVLNAHKAEIDELDAKKLTAEQADIKYANIDFSNIGQAAITKVFAESGIIKDLVVSEGNITGQLVGVTIKGDLIEGNTIIAEKLVVRGSDGILYKLNMEAGTFAGGEAVPDDSLHGSIIAAKSITAEKVSVNDLVAFDATIGGFKITDHSIYSGVKESVNNTTRGSYLDDEGQVAFGDSTNYLKYYKDQNGKYKLAISADSLVFSSNNKTVETVIKETVDQIEIGVKNLIRNSITMIFPDYYFVAGDAIDGNYLADETGDVLLDEYDDKLAI